LGNPPVPGLTAQSRINGFELLDMRPDRPAPCPALVLFLEQLEHQRPRKPELAWSCGSLSCIKPLCHFQQVLKRLGWIPLDDQGPRPTEPHPHEPARQLGLMRH